MSIVCNYCFLTLLFHNFMSTAFIKTLVRVVTVITTMIDFLHSILFQCLQVDFSDLSL